MTLIEEMLRECGLLADTVEYCRSIATTHPHLSLMYIPEVINSNEDTDSIDMEISVVGSISASFGRFMCERKLYFNQCGIICVRPGNSAG